MKAKEEANNFKADITSMNEKITEFSEEELKQISGGKMEPVANTEYCPFCRGVIWWDENNLSLRCDYFECINCGYITYFWDGCIWRKGRRTSW